MNIILVKINAVNAFQDIQVKHFNVHMYVHTALLLSGGFGE
jgi:hypothetical protein